VTRIVFEPGGRFRIASGVEPHPTPFTVTRAPVGSEVILRTASSARVRVGSSRGDAGADGKGGDCTTDRGGGGIGSMTATGAASGVGSPPVVESVGQASHVTPMMLTAIVARTTAGRRAEGRLGVYGALSVSGAIVWTTGSMQPIAETISGVEKEGASVGSSKGAEEIVAAIAVDSAYARNSARRYMRPGVGGRRGIDSP